jgi:hypothetical protein
MPTRTYNTIRSAILAGQNIIGDYKGYHRVMTPHTLGHKDGKEQCLFYQFAGESSSANTFPKNSPNNWRCITLVELKNVATTGGELHTCTQHTQPQTCVDVVDVESAF